MVFRSAFARSWADLQHCAEQVCCWWVWIRPTAPMRRTQLRRGICTSADSLCRLSLNVAVVINGHEYVSLCDQPQVLNDVWWTSDGMYTCQNQLLKLAPKLMCFHICNHRHCVVTVYFWDGRCGLGATRWASNDRAFVYIQFISIVTGVSIHVRSPVTAV